MQTMIKYAIKVLYQRLQSRIKIFDQHQHFWQFARSNEVQIHVKYVLTKNICVIISVIQEFDIRSKNNN